MGRRDEPLSATELTVLMALLRRYEANHATTASAMQATHWIWREAKHTRERVVAGRERSRG